MSKSCSKKVKIFDIAKSGCVVVNNCGSGPPKSTCFCRDKVSIVADNTCDTYWDTESSPDCDFIKGQAANGFYFIFAPNHSTGTVPISGPGQRLMYHSFKSALRNGTVTNTQWDDPSIGINSFASGLNTEASGNNSTALGSATDPNSQISAQGNSSFTQGRAETGGKLLALGIGSAAGGYANQLSTIRVEDTLVLGKRGIGAQAFGSALSGSIIRARGDGSRAYGSCLNSSEISVENQGSESIGYADSVSKITNLGLGSLSRGYCNFAGIISTGNDGSETGGYASGASSNITSSGRGALTKGYCDSAGKISSTGNGSLTTGQCSNSGQIINNGNGSEASGSVFGVNSSITCLGNGAVAKGLCSGGGSVINATAAGSFIFAAALGGSFLNSGAGSFLGGFCGSLEASNVGTSKFGTINYGRCLRTNNSNSAFFGKFAVARTGTISSVDALNTISGDGSLQIGGGTSGLATRGVGLILGTQLTNNVSPTAGGIANFWNASGADYAEFFEWEDQNLFGEDRVGRFVTFGNEGKIRVAEENEEDIIGIVSAAPGVVGDSAELYWHKSTACDNFGRPYIYIDYRQPIRDLLLNYEIEIPEELYEVDLDDILAKMKETKNLASTNSNRVTSGKDIFERIRNYLIANCFSQFNKKEETIGLFNIEIFNAIVPLQISFTNSDYDPDKEYIPRSARKEWSQIGLLGKLYVYDNGECIVGGKCDVGPGGIAVPGKTYRIIARAAWNVIRVFYR